MNRQIGPYELVDKLGEGGNEFVYRALDTRAGTEVALKEIKQDSNAHLRFGDEVEAHRRATSHEGVLPLLDWDVGGSDGDGPGWMVMPIAERLGDHLKDKSLDDVVAAMAEIAETLVALLDSPDRMSHRDLKPKNLFWLDDRAVIGDFGIATFDDKLDVTGNNRAMGAINFLPPEMRLPLGVDPAPADVYALAKTLWVLACDETWPPFGYQRLEYVPNLIAIRCDRPDANPLDRLVAQATLEDPKARPPMAEVAAELRAWLVVASQEEELRQASPLGRYRETLEAIRIEDERRKAAESIATEQRGELMAEARSFLLECVGPIGTALAEIGGSGDPVVEGGIGVLMPYGAAMTERLPEGFAITSELQSVVYKVGSIPRAEIILSLVATGDQQVLVLAIAGVAGARQIRLVESCTSSVAAAGSSALRLEIRRVANMAIGWLAPVLEALEQARRTGEPP